MEFRLLGPLEVRRGGATIALGGPRQRAVLAALLMRANEAVDVDHLAAAAWQSPPASAHSNVRTYLAALRRLLAEPADPEDRLVSTAEGYRLLVRSDELDVAAFECLAQGAGDAARRGDFAAVADICERAIRIWRGPPLAGLTLGCTLEVEVARLQELRLRLTEQRIDARMRLGEHAEVTGELRVHCAEHPFREWLSEQLMLALDRSGRRADALQVYRQTRDRMVTELGIEPGARLQRLHQSILGGKPADPLEPTTTPKADTGADRNNGSIPVRVAAPVPAQLPPAVPAFTGRARELAVLDRLLGRADGTVAIATICGTAGVGKSALGIHWAHLVANRFPDGQLYVDLRGDGAERPLTAAEALVRLLGGLGVPAEGSDHDVGALAALYRSVVAGRRMLVVLDNARTVEQVRPLVPGRAGYVVVTSRDTLGALTALQGARPIALDPLPPADAVALLGRILDDGRAHEEPEAVAQLVRLCGYLPLAVRLAAARLAARPQHGIAALVARIRPHGCRSVLRAPGDVFAAVRLAFDDSYASIDEPAQRLFHRLVLAPTPDVPVRVAAALVDATLDAVEPLLDALCSASMLDEEAPGRYRLRGLLREYAADRSDTEDSPAEREAAIRRARNCCRDVRSYRPPAHPANDHSDHPAGVDVAVMAGVEGMRQIVADGYQLP